VKQGNWLHSTEKQIYMQHESVELVCMKFEKAGYIAKHENQ